MAKKKYTLYLPVPLARKLDQVARDRHGAKSALVEEALRASIEPQHHAGMEEGLARRLDQISKTLAALVRDQTVATETLALFVRYFLTATPPVPDSEQESARLTGRKRYEVLVAEVGRRVAEDRRLAAEVLQTIPIDQPDLFAAVPGRQSRPAGSSDWIAGQVGRPTVMADLALAAAEEAQGRRRQMLRTAFGPTIAAALADPSVIEVMVNPDGRLWIERAAVGRRFSGEHVDSAEAERKNILVVGGTSSGKTTLVNALLAEVAGLDERVVILEDTRELKCAAADCVALRTKPGVATLADLVRSTLRLRPDRIIVGEVRGPEALDMLKAWNTGHPGGITTVHANSAAAGLYRLEQLVQEAVVTVPRNLIVEAIDIVVFLSGRGRARRVETLLELNGLDDDGEYVLKPLDRPILHPV